MLSFVWAKCRNLTSEMSDMNSKILFTKLESFGIRGVALELLKSYLTNRFQYTKVNGYSSSTKRITRGVPQGSTLGPLFFLMYVNDLSLCTKFFVTLFADDTYLMLSDKRIDYLQQKVNALLVKIGCWLRTNKLTLNNTKTNYMLINRVFGFNNSDFEVRL